jgi:hypothetical protein
MAEAKEPETFFHKNTYRVNNEIDSLCFTHLVLNPDNTFVLENGKPENDDSSDACMWGETTTYNGAWTADADNKITLEVSDGSEKEGRREITLEGAGKVIVVQKEGDGKAKIESTGGLELYFADLDGVATNDKVQGPGGSAGGMFEKKSW